MKTLNYNGFSNTPSTCEYGIGDIHGKTAIVFYQGAMGGTSITNMIEALTMHVLSTDLQGVDPAQVRVFEHYAPSLNPLAEWQEVTFLDKGEIQEDKGIARKLIELVLSSSNTTKQWYVNNPAWLPVNAADLVIVSAIQ
jgi:hypothetical protein